MNTTTIRLRRSTAAQAASNNVTLEAGEPGYETDTGMFKIGDGITDWNALPYATDLSRLPVPVQALAQAYLNGSIGPPGRGANDVTGMFHLSAYIDDFTGVNDQTENFQALVSAVSSAYAATGRPQAILWDKAGTVQVSSISWASGVSLKCSHHSFGCLRGTSQTAPIIDGYLYPYANPIVDVDIDGIEFDGALAVERAPDGYYDVNMKAIGLAASGRNVSVRNCFVHDFGATGIATDAATLGCRVMDNLVVDCGRLGGLTFNVVSLSGTTLYVSEPTTSVAVGMVVNNFADGLVAPAYGAAGNYPVTVAAVGAGSFTLSVAPADGTSGTVTVNVFAQHGGASGIGIGTALSGYAPVPPSGTQQWSSEPQLVTGNVVVGCTNYGIFHETQSRTSSSTAAGVIVANNICIGNATGIGLCGSLGQICTANSCWGNSRYGIAIDDGTLGRGTSRDTLVDGNACHDNAVANIALDLSSTSLGAPHGFQTIINNLCTGGTGHGIAYYVGGVTLKHPVRIANNTINGAGTSGLALTYDSGGNGTVYDTDIVGNQIYNSGTVVPAPGIEVSVTTNNLRIVGNHAFNDSTADTQSFGLLISAAFSGGAIRDNYLEGATAGASTASNVSATTWAARNAGMAAPIPAAVAVRPSPMSYTAPSFPTNLALVGGEVLSVTVGGVPMPTTGVIPLESGDVVVINYSSAPALTTRPR